MQAVNTENLEKSFGEVRALDQLNLTVEKGKLFGFIGPNGAGKTTTINILTGQIQPDRGKARVLGTDPTRKPKKVRGKVGILPEREDPPSFLTPREYFEFVGNIRKIEGLEEKVSEWSDRLEFKDSLDKMNKDLSKGEKQKVMITQAFIHEPELVFIDEPLINLDPVIQEKVKSYFKEYHSEGKTLFLSTHVMSLAEEVCTRVGILKEGRLVKTSPIDEIEGDLTHAFLEEVDTDSS
ncbi:MAG: ABC transporter ATP-binding protein [Candidatus Nanohaloarchaeota archaeon QJJ-9]|nr:ABC transporter ATP-binding protein [Candidatus Nanohaloarchaeota archaeon QJJ-9]